MLGRRTLLRAAVGGSVGIVLAGCAQQPTDPTPGRLERPTPSPLPAQGSLTTLVGQLDAARIGSWPAAQGTLIGWACGVVRDQCAAVSLPTPTPVPAAGPASETAEGDSLKALRTALDDARDAFRAQSLDAASARPLVWASMAAWAAATSDQLADPGAPLEPARSLLTPAEQSEAEAVQASLNAAEQAVYALRLVAGTPGLDDDEVDALAERTTFWLALRDRLTAAVPATATPTPAAPWYDLDRPSDVDGAREAAAQVEGAALPVLGRSFAYGPTDLQGVFVDALVRTARDVPRWGGLVERWPGLPHS